jgi:hypothetical protein
MQKFRYVNQGIFVAITQQFLNQCRTVYAGGAEETGGLLSWLLLTLLKIRKLYSVENYEGCK